MVHVTLSPLHAVQVDALFRPSSDDGLPVSPAGSALDAAAGVGWVDRSLTGAELPLGSAILTPPGDLSAEFVVHLIVRSAAEPVSERTVAEATRNAFRRCVEWGLSDVALPIVGTGPGNLDAETACATLASTVSEFLEAGAERSVTICAADEFERDTALAAFTPAT